MKASASLTVDAPIDRVFEFVSNIENMDLWVNGVTEPEWTSESRARVGATFRSLYTYGGRTHEMGYEITALEPPTVMATRSTSGPFPFDAELTLLKVEDGTRLTNTLDAKATNLPLAVWFKVFGGLIRPFMRRQLRRELMLVKTLLETSEGGE